MVSSFYMSRVPRIGVSVKTESNEKLCQHKFSVSTGSSRHTCSVYPHDPEWQVTRFLKTLIYLKKPAEKYVFFY